MNMKEDQRRAVNGRCWGSKHFLERVAALFGLVATLPLLGVLAALVKMTSRGPVLYVAKRLGCAGRVFDMIKFRTMQVDAPLIMGEDGRALTLEHDPRFTSIAGFMRLGFDELPQLVNVVRGDMCLVGPRPHLPVELSQHTELLRGRLSVLPGITGLAAVVGGRDMSNAENYELDAIYVEESSLVMDLKILLLTLPYALGLRKIGAWAFADIVTRARERARHAVPQAERHSATWPPSPAWSRVSPGR